MKHTVALLLLLSSGTLLAQQTGVMVNRAPGSAVGKGLPTEVVRAPKATCDSPGIERAGAPVLPELVFSRMMDDLVCVRHPDGHSEQWVKGGPWTSYSPNGNDVAYWVPEKHELRVFAVNSHSETVVDTQPGAVMRQMVWSSKGRTLAYALNNANPPGIRVVDLDTGKRQTVPASYSGIVGFADPDLVIVGFDGVQRINIADGRREAIAAVKYAAQAQYSRSGALLGILANNVNESDVAATDDEPDCTGGTFALFVHPAAGRTVKIPFPKGFDSVLDFEFSPDDHAIAVTFGAAACDYPGDVARVYVVSLPGLTLKPVTPEDHLSVKAHWSPDGRALVYTDYSGGSDAPLMVLDFTTGKMLKLTSPGLNGPDEFLGWH